MKIINQNFSTNIEAEQAVISAIVARNGTYDHVSGFLRPEHFSEPFYGLIFKVCRSLIECGKSADPITLKAFIVSKTGGEERSDLDEQLNRMQSVGLSIINVVDYAAIIVDRYRKRELIAVFEAGIEEMTGDPAFDFYGHITENLDRLADASAIDDLRERRDLGDSVLAEVERKINLKGRIGGICTGITELDRNLDGLNKGNLYIWAGRPGMGKSAFIATVASNMLASGRKVGIFSLEMTDQQFFRRILSIRSEIPYWRIDRGAINPSSEMEILMTEERGIKGLMLSDRANIGTNYIRSVARSWKRKGCDVLFVDHLGLVELRQERGMSQAQAIGNFTKSMKVLAKELDMPVVLLSQLNREVEKRDKKRPSLADLRDSGSIEQDADVVIFLYRGEYYLNLEKPEAGDEKYHKWQSAMDAKRGRAELIISKNRHGSAGIVNVDFNSELMKFSDENTLRKVA